MLPGSKPKGPGACYELLRQTEAFLLLIDGAERRYNQRSMKMQELTCRNLLTKTQDSLISENRRPWSASYITQKPPS